mmetsp:Transcript_10353/g.28488  ORF Transcript_10353/g.28488 Transcript_10353/m.28488 type:complete len:233 (-) Transcript_10353:200-898(-)|eukprot:CAMPEP_0198134846 /NCGR_PEP_ID=MMETSP1442-20131203/60282_1 /TAXON_ID= /ORGANISM="Craspedostauros australis, Strain CCMP3328" /LENGTH=232 /DNA_ID=CAMNT_0043796001 /DNA_START=1601 /DNA_END=2299 /DNA_ORIENTATION=-
MTLMGVPQAAFSVGTSSTTKNADVEMSLDDMIKSRRQEQQKSTRAAAKKPATAVRSIATGRAKRAAAVNARRGIASSATPKKADVKREIARQEKKTVKAKQINQKKASGGRVKVPTNSRKAKKDAGKGAASANAVFVRPPTKKAIKAAVSAMEGAGYQVPNGMQVVVSLAPKDIPAKQNQTKQNARNVNGKGKGNSNSNNNSNNNSNKARGNNHAQQPKGKGRRNNNGNRKN